MSDTITNNNLPAVHSNTQVTPLTDDPVKAIKQINFYYKVCWIGILIGAPLSLILLNVFFIGFFVAALVLFGIIYGFHLLHLLWTLIPADIARATPDKAVGYSFIPVFTCYWAFLTYKGLAEDMNKTLEQRGLQYRVNEILGIILWICVILFHTPLGIVAVPVSAIVWVLFLKSVKDGALALLEQEKQ